MKQRSILENYKKRQVIINTFEDDCLMEKDGYFFDSITFNKSNLEIKKANETIFSLDISTYTFKTLEGFNHYYSFSNPNKKVELYFP